MPFKKGDWLTNSLYKKGFIVIIDDSKFKGVCSVFYSNYVTVKIDIKEAFSMREIFLEKNYRKLTKIEEMFYSKQNRTNLSEYDYHLDLFISYVGINNEISYEWELNVKNESFNKISVVATAEITPSVFRKNEYEVFFSDCNNNWTLGQSCSLEEANSRIKNAIKKYKRNGTLENVYEYTRFFHKNEQQ